MLVFRYDPFFMVKKPPEKPFQIKIFKMAVESDQVGIQRKSKTANFAWFKKVNFAQNKHIRWLSMVNRQKNGHLESVLQ